MDCNTTVSLIDPYLQGKLTGKQKEQFLSHILSCEKCYEELDISFIVAEGIKGLDHEEEMDFNFASVLKNKVNKEQLMIQRHKHHRRIITLLIIFAVVVFVSLALLWEGHQLFHENGNFLFWHS